jgi:hypothetical protein
MRTREKLTLEEKFALALALIKREQSLDEIRLQYRISHTTAYKIRNAFLEGGRAALSGERRGAHAHNLEARVSALEALMGNDGNGRGTPRNGRGERSRKSIGRLKPPPDLVRADGVDQVRRAGK